jgi:PncC family amidohydrolase
MKQTLEEQLQNIFIQRQWTLSLAESCTGGAIAARLTRLSGCSCYFLGSIVSYSNSLKVSILGVEEHLIQQFGAVSAEVVSQMAQGALKVTQSDFSLAISGIAGPTGGSIAKPVGTVWAAIGRQDQSPLVWCFQLKGSREEIIQQSVEVVLQHLLTFIL